MAAAAFTATFAALLPQRDVIKPLASSRYGWPQDTMAI